MENRVIGILPALLHQSTIAMSGVLDKTISVAIAIFVDPIKRCTNVRPYILDKGVISRPVVISAGQHNEQRCCIHCPVIPRERNFIQVRHFSMAHLVQDFPRFGFIRRINSYCLCTRQKLQDALRQRGLHPEHLKRGNDSVPPEDCAEPRNTGIGIVGFRVTDRHHLNVGG